MEIYIFYFSSKTYVVGTQKNRLNKTIPLSTQNITILHYDVRTPTEDQKYYNLCIYKACCTLECL